MKPEKDRRDWERIWKSLNDPEVISKARREKEKEDRLDDLKKDTGYE